MPFGLPAIDVALPGGGLALGALHEAWGAGPQVEHGTAASLLAVWLLARVPGEVVWVMQQRDLYPPALAAVGLTPERVLFVHARNPKTVLLVTDEGLRHAGLAGVVGELSSPLSLTASRRLQLAAETSGVTDGGEVVEDYRSVGLSLRRHPVAFLRDDLSRRGMIGCGDLARTRDGLRVKVSGIVLVRQRPGSASGVLFITIEDETGVANLIVWPSVFELHRRLVLGATMLACHGRVQREGDVIHVIADGLEDLSDLLRSVGGRNADVPTRAGRGDEARHGIGVDTRMPGGIGPGAFGIADLRREGGIKVPTRDFR